MLPSTPSQAAEKWGTPGTACTPLLGLLNPTSAGFQGCTLKVAPVPSLLPAAGELHLSEAVALIQPYPERQR